MEAILGGKPSTRPKEIVDTSHELSESEDGEEVEGPDNTSMISENRDSDHEDINSSVDAGQQADTEAGNTFPNIFPEYILKIDHITLMLDIKSVNHFFKQGCQWSGKSRKFKVREKSGNLGICQGNFVESQGNLRNFIIQRMLR